MAPATVGMAAPGSSAETARGQGRTLLPGDGHDDTLGVLSHLGLGDMLALRGAVSALARRHASVALVCLRRHASSARTMFEDDPGDIKLVLVDEACAIAPEFGADGGALEALRAACGAGVLLLGDHASSAGGEWRRRGETWPEALYACAGVDHATWRPWPSRPRGRAAQAARMLERVRSLFGDRYVVVHDDDDRPLILPASADGPALVHVDDPRLRSDNIFDYVDVLENATHVHSIDSCFALLMDALDVRTPLTVHAYARDEGAKLPYYRLGGAAEVLRSRPAARSRRHGLAAAEALAPATRFSDELIRAFCVFQRLQDTCGPTRAEWAPCGGYLMGPDSLDYEPAMRPKQELLFDVCRARAGGRMLEIGAHAGHSALLALLAGMDVVCVDPCGWEHTPRCLAVLRACFPGRVTLLRGTSQAVLPLLEGTFEVIHVDGDHSYEASKHDMEHAHRLSYVQTVFVFDDYSGGVARAADELAHKFRVVLESGGPWGNCAAVRRDVVTQPPLSQPARPPGSRA